MEHACYNCGAKVEDGTPFCPVCGAPQIRVSVPVDTSPAFPPGPLPELEPQPQPLPVRDPGEMDWRQALPAAALAAGLGGFVFLLIAVAEGQPKLSFIAWMVGSGLLSVPIYRRKHLGNITTLVGAKVGALAGLLSFIIFAILTSGQILASRGGGQLRAMLEEQLKRSVSQSGDAATQALLQRFLTPEGMATLIALGMVLMLFGFLILASIGGAIAGTFFADREQS